MQQQNLKFFQLHNPFYLLSAFCMLVGCYGLIRVARAAAVQSEALLVLMGVLHVYELALVGLAWYLIKSRRAVRDGRMLLLLELVFLVDATYLQGEYSSVNPRQSAVVGLLVLTLVVLKVGAMLSALGRRLSWKTQVFLLTHFGVLFGVPTLAGAVFRQVSLSSGLFYGLWWVLAVLPLFQIGIIRELRKGPFPESWLRPIDKNFRTALVVLPYLSIGWHVLTLHWLYDVPFHTAYVAPVILGWVVGLSIVGVPWMSRQRCTGIIWVGTLAAIVLSVSYPQTLLFEASFFPGLMLSPLRLMLLAVAAVYFFGYWSHRRRLFFAAALTASLMAGAGHSLHSILVNLTHAFGRILPRTLAEWCMVSVVLAFVFLAAGAALSLSRNDHRSGRRPLKRQAI
jgi:hypothetical protein